MKKKTESDSLIVLGEEWEGSLMFQSELPDEKMRGALHSSEKAYESFAEQKDLNGFLMDFA